MSYTINSERDEPKKEGDILAKRMPSLRRNLQYTALALALTTFCIVGLSLVAYDSAIDAYARHSFEALSAGAAAQVENVIDNLESTGKAVAYAPQVQTALFTSTPTEYLDVIAEADQIINLLRDESQYAEYIYILNQSGRQGYVKANAKTICRPWLLKYLEEGMHQEKPFFSPVFESEVVGDGHPYFLYVMPVVDIRAGHIGTPANTLCAVACEVEAMLRIFRQESAQGTTLCLLSGGQVIASSGALTADECALILSQEDSTDASTYVYHISHPRLPWTLAVLTSRDMLSGSAPRMRSIAVLLLLAEMVVLVALFAALFLTVARPLRRLVSDVQAVYHTQYTRVRPARMAEFITLSDAINRMLSEIEEAGKNESESRERLYAAQEEQTRAKLYAYRTQINPHFLFNALECIRSLAQAHGVPEIEKQVCGLSRSYRYLLNADMVVTLAEELRSVEGYFNVLRPQYTPQPVLRFCVDERVKNMQVLAMTLQPLIENALLHGLSGRSRPGIILISAWIETDGALILQVADNGRGISPERLQVLRRQCNEAPAPGQEQHIGLLNIVRRMRLFFGPSFRFAITSREGHYTCIRLYIPTTVPKEEVDS